MSCKIYPTFSGQNPPPNHMCYDGDFWFNPKTDIMYVYDSSYGWISLPEDMYQTHDIKEDAYERAMKIL